MPRHRTRNGKTADVSARALLRRSGITRAEREASLAVQRFFGRVFATAPANRPDPTGPLRILACTPTYLPEHRRGAEVTLHATLSELVRRGHRAKVAVETATPCTELDGVEVIAAPKRADVAGLARWADVVLGQLASRQRALGLAARHRRPAVYFVHIGNVPRRALAGRPALTVFSSQTVREQCAWIEPALVVHPPINPDAYRTTPGDAITLVNLSEAKGASLFFELARRLPDREFLGVRGWGPQAFVPDLANLHVVGPLHDMREAYSRTRVLLVPSVYESYGRVALEAAASGIPTIASPMGGMREALGDACLWADRGDVTAWIAALERLEVETEYSEWGARARRRLDELDPEAEAAVLERALFSLLEPERP
jgi:glycosyltransferase involved in cell wall biosynthesis